QELEPEGVRRVRPMNGVEPGARLEVILARLVLKETKVRRYDAAYVRISASTSLVPIALFERRIPIALELNGRILEEMKRLKKSDLAIRIVKTSLAGAIGLSRVLVAVDVKIGAYAKDVLRSPRVVVIENGADLDVAIPGER